MAPARHYTGSEREHMAAAGKKILKVAIADLTLDPENARKHGDRDIDAIAASLEQFGQQSPIVITADKLVAKGNGTLMAAMKLGWEHIDAVQTTLSGAELRAYAIADNQTGLLSEWDISRLTEQLQGIEAEQVMLLAALGFNDHELGELLGAATVEHQAVELDEIEEDTKDAFSIRVDGVSPEDKQAILDGIASLLESGGYGYSAAAY